MKQTQQQRILNYIDTFGSITQQEAFIDLGIMRLASRISDLKKDGVAIKKETITAKNRFGETVAFARYSRPEAQGND